MNNVNPFFIASTLPHWIEWRRGGDPIYLVGIESYELNKYWHIKLGVPTVHVVILPSFPCRCVVIVGDQPLYLVQNKVQFKEVSAVWSYSGVEPSDYRSTDLLCQVYTVVDQPEMEKQLAKVHRRLVLGQPAWIPSSYSVTCIQQAQFDPGFFSIHSFIRVQMLIDQSIRV